MQTTVPISFYFLHLFYLELPILMASMAFETLDDEVRELLQNYRYKKATAYEPCTLKNFKECLIGLHEVLYFILKKVNCYHVF